jgi:hypothetical protein
MLTWFSIKYWAGVLFSNETEDNFGQLFMPSHEPLTISSDQVKTIHLKFFEFHLLKIISLILKKSISH